MGAPSEKAPAPAPFARMMVGKRLYVGLGLVLAIPVIVTAV
jgi:hypothetical protein